MKKWLAFSFIFGFSFQSYSLNWSDEAGVYHVRTCAGLSSHSPLNYCQYDEVHISTEASDASKVNFDFLTQGQSLLKFQIVATPSVDNVMNFDENSQKISLTSTDSVVQSQLSIENDGDGKLLILSSLQQGQAYEFDMYLSKKY
jgi:hypothetical protein